MSVIIIIVHSTGWKYNIILHVIYILIRSFDSPRLGWCGGDARSRTHTHTAGCVNAVKCGRVWCEVAAATAHQSEITAAGQAERPRSQMKSHSKIWQKIQELIFFLMIIICIGSLRLYFIRTAMKLYVNRDKCEMRTFLVKWFDFSFNKKFRIWQCWARPRLALP